MALSFAETLRTNRLEAIAAAVGPKAILRIYSGNAPATVSTALTNNTQLAELTWADTFASPASGGVLTLNSITQDASADATGTATFFRIFTSNETAVMQGTVGTSGCDLNLNTAAISSGAAVSITRFTITEGNA